MNPVLAMRHSDLMKVAKGVLELVSEFNLPGLSAESVPSPFLDGATKFFFTCGGHRSEDVCIFDLQFLDDPFPHLRGVLQRLSEKMEASK